MKLVHFLRGAAAFILLIVGCIVFLTSRIAGGVHGDFELGPVLMVRLLAFVLLLVGWLVAVRSARVIARVVFCGALVLGIVQAVLNVPVSLREHRNLLIVIAYGAVCIIGLMLMNSKSAKQFEEFSGDAGS